MTITQRFSLIWRRFTPLEERLLSAVRDALPLQAQTIFDAQVAGITLVQRLPSWTEIDFYRRRHGKVDWSDIPAFPHTGEFRLAEIRFASQGRRYKATLISIAGHIFDFAITPSPKAIAFAAWDSAPSSQLLSDPLIVEARRVPEPISAEWRDFLARRPQQQADDWKFHDADTAYRTTFDEGEFLILAERAGDEFVLHRIEPPASSLFYLASHDATPEPIAGKIEDVFRETNKRNV
ncbi:MAG: hypothetical protein WBW41_21030 [Verrucomicrobiia bacterium]